MKAFFEKLGFHKMDEMEKNIALRAQRNALLYVMVALLIWSLHESFEVYTKNTALNLFPSFLLITTVLVQLFSQLVLQKRAVKGDEEYHDDHPLWKIIVSVVVASAVIVALGSLITLWVIG